MAKGAQSKEQVFKKILEVFPGSFMQDDKICRIPMTEDGQIVEIKVTLTAAKDVLGSGVAAAAPKEEFDWSNDTLDPVSTVAANDLSDTEKDNIRKMMEALGL